MPNSRFALHTVLIILHSMPLIALLLFFVALPPVALAAATPAEQLTVAPGFKVELLKSANPEREGSWVSMAIDDKGRLYISPQNKAPDGGIMRVTLDDTGHITKTDWLKLDVGAAMGMCWAFDSLYVSGEGPDGQAIYRLRDTNGDGELDKAGLFKKVPGGGGEHGAHAIVLGPDNMLYLVHGNSTPLIEGVDPNSPYRNYGEEILIPRVLDPVATFFDKLKVPYGHVLRTDENGSRWELIAGGMRNAYDIDFNPDGELFTYDSDMEWDVGLPWYRPSRVLHIVPGAEFGFREGNQEWPDYYPDSLPPVCDIGLGCPTGVKFGTKSNFPEKYRRAFFIMDWTFGRLLAVHLHPQGASYTASNPLASYLHPTKPEASADVEVFLSGKAMPLTDMEFGKDGAMYFTVGGRGAQAGLYRVSYNSSAKSEEAPQMGDLQLGRERREKMKQLIAGNPEPYLLGDSSAPELHPILTDPFWFFAALHFYERAYEGPHRSMRLGGLDEESRPEHVATEKLMELLTEARKNPKSAQRELLEELKHWPFDKLSEKLKLLKLRIIKVSFVRQGRPADDLVQLGIEKLNRQYPAKSFRLNRELSELLVWLGAPDAVEKTLALLESAPTQEEQIWYACMLREAQGWTAAQRERYFAWFHKAREFKGGNSLPKFIERIKEQALEKLSDAERGALATVINAPPPAPKPHVPQVRRAFQKHWAMADFAGALPRVTSGRNFARGKEIFASTQCLQCHHFGTDGGNVGPDLTASGNRFNARDLLEAIIEPSKVISEQYARFIFNTRQGQTVVGQVVDENNDALIVLTDPLAGTRQAVGKLAIASKEISPVSLMPPGLIDVLTEDEVLDLLAYVVSGGNEKAPAFEPAK
jgi:putative heme-binding domain-containing protein